MILDVRNLQRGNVWNTILKCFFFFLYQELGKLSQFCDWTTGWTARVRFPTGQYLSPDHKVGTSSAAYQVGTAFLSSGVKQPGREANHSLPSITIHHTSTWRRVYLRREKVLLLHIFLFSLFIFLYLLLNIPPTFSFPSTHLPLYFPFFFLNCKYVPVQTKKETHVLISYAHTHAIYSSFVSRNVTISGNILSCSTLLHKRVCLLTKIY
jgi:hypothetical protein